MFMCSLLPSIINLLLPNKKVNNFRITRVSGCTRDQLSFVTKAEGKFKEMIFTYASEGKSERITMYARNYGVTGREKGETFIEFWTESQVEKVADLILVLKKII